MRWIEIIEDTLLSVIEMVDDFPVNENWSETGISGSAAVFWKVFSSFLIESMNVLDAF